MRAANRFGAKKIGVPLKGVRGWTNLARAARGLHRGVATPRMAKSSARSPANQLEVVAAATTDIRTVRSATIRTAPPLTLLGTYSLLIL